MDTTSAISEDDEYRDFSDPEVCIDLFRRMRGTSLKVNYETQVSLKRLNSIHFNERARLLKKKKPLHRKIVDVISEMKLRKMANPAKKLKKEAPTPDAETNGEKLPRRRRLRTRSMTISTPTRRRLIPTQQHLYPEVLTMTVWSSLQSSPNRLKAPTPPSKGG